LHAQTKFRLLVVRLSAMGDILHALPAVTALRRAHPAWEIGWVVDPRWQALLASPETGPEAGAVRPPDMPIPSMPIVDRLHFAPAKEWGRNPLSAKTANEIRALRRELRACNYDAAIDLQGAIRSATIAHMAGSQRRIGEDSPREWAARWLFTDRVVTHGAHVIEQDVELASAIAGDALVPVAPLLPVAPAAEAWCDELLAAGGTRPVALINPGAGWGAKRWPVERYATVARGLLERGFRVLVNAGPGEEPLAKAIQTSVGVTTGVGAAGPALELFAASLQQLIALTRRIALCVAGDTGPLHLASALGRPVVGIYGPTDPRRNGPFWPHAIVLRNPASRRDHTRRDQPEAGLLTIAPEDVLRAADTLLREENAG
jgi:heptosyltransferase-1